MAVTYEKGRRESATAQSKWLLTIDLDGRPAKTFGRMTVELVATKEEADILLDAYHRIMELRKKNRDG